LAGEIPAKGFFLLERTDDETVPNIPADQIYKGALGNTGEKLELYYGLGNLIDQVDCSSGWFSGNNETKQTMERKGLVLTGSDSANWQTSLNSGGTPKAKNSEQLATSNEQNTIDNEQLTTNNQKDGTAEIKQELIQQKEEVKIYPSGIVFNEILPSPKGADSAEEWVEIYNQNDFDVDLSNWKISDTAGKTTTYTFPAGAKISAKGFLVLNRPTTKITLNNDSDGLNLVQPNGNILDKVYFEKAPIGESYNRIDNSWAWSSNLTPGLENIIPAERSEKEDQTENIQEKGLAAISEFLVTDNEPAKETDKFNFILLSALGISVLSGITIIFLKKKLKKEG
jgi:hypothetical protein